MKQIVHISLIVMLAVFANSCKKENAGDCFKSAGKMTTTSRNVTGFTRIKVEDKLEVYLTQGNEYKVEVEAGGNLQSNIKTVVEDSTLTISNINKCNFVRSPKTSIKVFVTLPRLRYVRSGGVGAIYFQNQFTGDSMDVRIGNSGDVHINVNVKYLTTSTHGNGDLYAIGSADVSSHYTNGTNYLHLEELVIKNNIILSTYTIGDCYINAPTNGPINLEIWESGNVYYKGTPTDLYLIKKGKGEVFQK